MSCPDCEYEQKKPARLFSDEVFVRVGTGNVQIIACKGHTKETIEKLRLANAIAEANRQ